MKKKVLPREKHARFTLRFGGHSVLAGISDGFLFGDEI